MPRAAPILAALALGAALQVVAQPTAPDVFVRADKGHCIACHQLPEGTDAATRADLGPRLEGARMRSLGKAALRSLIADPMSTNPETVMPPFGRHRILKPAEIDQLVEFLHALP